MHETTADKLRRVAAEIRRKPTPIKDLIPLLLLAADDLESLNSILSAKEVNEHSNPGL